MWLWSLLWRSLGGVGLLDREIDFITARFTRIKEFSSVIFILHWFLEVWRVRVFVNGFEEYWWAWRGFEDVQWIGGRDWGLRVENCGFWALAGLGLVWFGEWVGWLGKGLWMDFHWRWRDWWVGRYMWVGLERLWLVLNFI